MGLNFTRGLSALAIAMLPLAGTTAVFSIIGADAVHAGGGNGNGHGNGNGNGNGNGRANGRSSDRGGHASEDRGPGQGNGHGAVARELKGLNACHASDQARANAATDSQVGRIATYAAAAEQTEIARNEWQVAYDSYKAFEGSYTGRSSTAVQADIDALDPASPTYDADLAALQAEQGTALSYEGQLAQLASVADGLKVAYDNVSAEEQAALDTASGGRELSEQAVAALRDCLDS